VPPRPAANLTPAGSRPAQVILGAGSPVAVTVNVNATPKPAVVADRLVKAGPRVPAAGVIAMSPGSAPTGIAGPAVSVAVAIGVTVADSPLTT
jgi:hypothetical protein